MLREGLRGGSSRLLLMKEVRFLHSLPLGRGKIMHTEIREAQDVISAHSFWEGCLMPAHFFALLLHLCGVALLLFV